MMSPYALEVYRNTKNIKIRTGSPSPLPLESVGGGAATFPCSLCFGQLVCSESLVLIRPWGTISPLALCFIGHKNALDFLMTGKELGKLTICHVSSCHCFHLCLSAVPFFFVSVIGLLHSMKKKSSQ